MYKIIIDPHNKKKYSLFSSKGKKILKKFLKNYLQFNYLQKGGSISKSILISEDIRTDEAIENSYKYYFDYNDFTDPIYGYLTLKHLLSDILYFGNKNSIEWILAYKISNPISYSEVRIRDKAFPKSENLLNACNFIGYFIGTLLKLKITLELNFTNLNNNITIYQLIINKIKKVDKSNESNKSTLNKFFKDKQDEYKKIIEKKEDIKKMYLETLDNLEKKLKEKIPNEDHFFNTINEILRLIFKYDTNAKNINSINIRHVEIINKNINNNKIYHLLTALLCFITTSNNHIIEYKNGLIESHNGTNGYELFSNNVNKNIEFYKNIVGITSNLELIVFKDAFYKNKLFSDCGETALRNFLIILIYNSEENKLDINKLNNLRPTQNLIDYFTTYNTIEKQKTQEARNKWANLVSNIKTVQYKKQFIDNTNTINKYELQSLSDTRQRGKNFIIILNNLFHEEISDFNVFESDTIEIKLEIDLLTYTNGAKKLIINDNYNGTNYIIKFMLGHYQAIDLTKKETILNSILIPEIIPNDIKNSDTDSLNSYIESKLNPQIKKFIKLNLVKTEIDSSFKGPNDDLKNIVSFGINQKNYILYNYKEDELVEINGQGQSVIDPNTGYLNFYNYDKVKSFIDKDNPPIITFYKYVGKLKYNYNNLYFLSKIHHFDSTFKFKFFLNKNINNLHTLTELNLYNNGTSSLSDQLDKDMNFFKTLNDNEKTKIFESISKLKNLNSLYLSFREKDTILSKLHLTNLNKLTTLGLSSKITYDDDDDDDNVNILTKIPKIIFQIITLENLYLENNNFTELTEDIIRLKKLETLNLKNNKLTKLPESFIELKNLKTLNLSYNRLTELPANFGELTNLINLELFYNKLTKLPESFVELKNLKILNLSTNRQLTELPANFGKLPNLINLKLYNNKLTKLPESFVELKNLKTLELSNNDQLTELPANFGKLTQLEELKLSENKIKSLPESFVELKNLKTLDLNFNLLEELPANFGGLTQLEELKLRKNKIKSLPDDLGKLTRLKSLDLTNQQSGYKLKKIPKSLKDLINLEYLLLDYNEIEFLLETHFRNLKKLKKVSLTHNNLTELPLSLFDCCPNIKDLEFRDNYLNKWYLYKRHGRLLVKHIKDRLSNGHSILTDLSFQKPRQVTQPTKIISMEDEINKMEKSRQKDQWWKGPTIIYRGITFFAEFIRPEGRDESEIYFLGLYEKGNNDVGQRYYFDMDKRHEHGFFWDGKHSATKSGSYELKYVNGFKRGDQMVENEVLAKIDIEVRE